MGLLDRRYKGSPRSALLTKISGTSQTFENMSDRNPLGAHPDGCSPLRGVSSCRLCATLLTRPCIYHLTIRNHWLAARSNHLENLEASVHTDQLAARLSDRIRSTSPPRLR